MGSNILQTMNYLFKPLIGGATFCMLIVHHIFISLALFFKPHEGGSHFVHVAHVHVLRGMNRFIPIVFEVGTETA